MNTTYLFARFTISVCLLCSPALLSQAAENGGLDTESETTETDPNQRDLKSWDAEWFGNFSSTLFEDLGWIWHIEHGWIFPLESNWAYVTSHGWIWTDESIYPVVYRMHDQAWLWYFIGSSEPNEFHNYTTDSHESH